MDWHKFALDESFKFPSHARILDVGCGLGTHLRSVSGIQSVGIDIDYAQVVHCHSLGLIAAAAKADIYLSLTSHSMGSSAKSSCLIPSKIKLSRQSLAYLNPEVFVI